MGCVAHAAARDRDRDAAAALPIFGVAKFLDSERTALLALLIDLRAVTTGVWNTIDQAMEVGQSAQPSPLQLTVRLARVGDGRASAAKSVCRVDKSWTWGKNSRPSVQQRCVQSRHTGFLASQVSTKSRQSTWLRVIGACQQHSSSQNLSESLQSPWFRSAHHFTLGIYRIAYHAPVYVKPPYLQNPKPKPKRVKSITIRVSHLIIVQSYPYLHLWRRKEKASASASLRDHATRRVGRK